MNQLAKIIIEDGQPLRAIHNYLYETFDGVKTIELFDRTFTDRIEFIEFIQNVVCPCILSGLNEFKLDDPKLYEQSNK
jgi:hypothetical protein